MVSVTIRVDENVRQQLKFIAAKTGKTQYELANQFLIEGIKNYKIEVEPMTIEEIEKLLEHDQPEGNGLKELDGIIEKDNHSDAVQLKKDTYKL